jgi:hypothetical protein
LTWFSFVLSCFWFAQLLESVRLSHLPNLPTQYVFLSFFSHTVFILSFWKSIDTHLRCHHGPQFPELCVLSPCCHYWIISPSYYLDHRFFPLFFHSTVEPM